MPDARTNQKRVLESKSQLLEPHSDKSPDKRASMHSMIVMHLFYLFLLYYYNKKINN